MKLCDLHSHTNYSDGTLSPEQLVELAKQQQLEALVLCDHNTVAGLPAFLQAAEGSGVEPIPGVEFSTEYGDTELHIIMLFVQPEHYEAVTRLVEQLRVNKQKSNRDMVAALAADGIVVDYEAMLASVPGGYINRAHFAAELTRLGYTASVQEAFKGYLSEKGKYFTPPKRLDVFETLRFIRQLGGVSVLAHPYLNLDQTRLEQFLPQAIESGLDAMEVLYSKYDESTTKLAAETAEKYGLLPSGGSDFHGENKQDIQLGTGRGNLRIPMAFLEGLKQRKKEKNR